MTHSGGRRLSLFERIGSSLRYIRRIVPYLGIPRTRTALVTTLLLVEALLGLVVPWQLGRAIDLLVKRNGVGVTVALAVLLLAEGGALLTAYANLQLRSNVVWSASRNLSLRAFEAFQAKPYSAMTSIGIGEIINRTIGEAEAVAAGMVNVETSVLMALGTLLFAFVAMMYVNWMLACASVLFIPLWLLVVWRPGHRPENDISTLRARYSRAVEEANTLIAERLSPTGLARAWALRSQRHDAAAFFGAMDAMRRSRERVDNRSGLIDLQLSGVATLFAPLCVLGLGAVLVMQRDISAGALFAYIGLQQRMIAPMNVLGSLEIRVASLAAAAERLLELLDGHRDTRSVAGVVTPTDAAPAIEVRGLALGQGGRQLTEPLTFTVRSGELFVIAGPSGAGKTTLLHTVLGLLDDDDRVRLFGLPPRAAIENGVVRVGYVSQSEAITSESIAENVRYGRGGHNDERIWKSLALSELRARVELLPDLLDHRVDAAGAALSGGEKQRLAIARAVYDQPHILFLDEATSALDPSTERAIVANLVDGVPGMTIVFVTHRDAVIQLASTVLRLDEGQASLTSRAGAPRAL